MKYKFIQLMIFFVVSLLGISKSVVILVSSGKAFSALALFHGAVGNNKQAGSNMGLAKVGGAEHPTPLPAQVSHHKWTSAEKVEWN